MGLFLEAAAITTEVAAGHREVAEHLKNRQSTKGCSNDEIPKSWNRKVMLSLQCYPLKKSGKYLLHFYKD